VCCVSDENIEYILYCVNAKGSRYNIWPIIINWNSSPSRSEPLTKNMFKEYCKLSEKCQLPTYWYYVLFIDNTRTRVHARTCIYAILCTLHIVGCARPINGAPYGYGWYDYYYYYYIRFIILYIIILLSLLCALDVPARFVDDARTKHQ